MATRGESLRPGSSGDPRAQALASSYGPVSNLPSTIDRPFTLQDEAAITGLSPQEIGQQIGNAVTPQPRVIGQRLGEMATKSPAQQIGTRIAQMGAPGAVIGKQLGAKVGNPDDRRAQMLLRAVVGKNVDFDTKTGRQLAFGTHRISELWPSLSPGQRSLAISGLAATAIEHRTGGKALSQYVVPGSDNAIGGPLKVGHVNDVMRSGQNGLALARNWNQLSAMTAMQGKLDHKNPKQVARLSEAFGMLGSGNSGGATKISGEELQQRGAHPMPEFGIGAVGFNNRNQVPKNYKIITETPDRKIVALPNAHASTASVGENHQLAYNRSQTVSQGKHPAQKLWKAPPSRGVTRGAAGGSAIISGMGMMAEKNPYLAGSISAYSLFNNQLGD